MIYVIFSLLNPIMLKSKTGKNRIIKSEILKVMFLKKDVIKNISIAQSALKNRVVYSIKPSNLLLKS